jgi:hypothetical protein
VTAILVCMLPFYGALFFGFFASMYRVYERPGIYSIVVFLCSATLTCWLSRGLWKGRRELVDMFVCRVVPYFEKCVGVTGYQGKWPFDTGVELARQCRRLDGLASSVGTRPLSSFGFADDLHGQRLRWHDPAEAILTISNLENALAMSVDKERPALLSDLRNLRTALVLAQQQRIQFCLLVRSGTFSDSTQGEANRKGTFW